jgi:hypothetical protein
MVGAQPALIATLELSGQSSTDVAAMLRVYESFGWHLERDEHRIRARRRASLRKSKRGTNGRVTGIGACAALVAFSQVARNITLITIRAIMITSRSACRPMASGIRFMQW